MPYTRAFSTKSRTFRRCSVRSKEGAAGQGTAAQNLIRGSGLNRLRRALKHVINGAAIPGWHSHMVPPSFSWTRMAHKTRAQRLRHRQSLQVWYPRTSDLRLPDVPTSEQAEVRETLNWLGKFPVLAGTCWQTAQAVTLLAHDPRVQYVDGVSWNV